MDGSLGISQEGLQTALQVKEDYRKGQPICVPGEHTRILIPEYLMNHDLDLRGFEDPVPLALVSIRDPEPPMALAAITRMSPLGAQNELVSGVFDLVGESTRHPLVRECVSMVRESAFNPNTISTIHRHATRFIIRTREQ